MLAKLFLLIILILINAFFASSEIALISLNDRKIKRKAEKGDKKAKLLQKLLKEPGNFLATIQIGITLAGFLASAFAAESFADRLGEQIKQTGINIPITTLKTVSLILITLILSYFTLVLGELVPKRLAMKKAEKISGFAAKPLYFLYMAFSPFIKLLTMSTNLIVRICGINPDKEEKHVTEEEIRMMIDAGEEKGTIQKTEKEMINNVFEFDNKTVKEIMTHRTAITSIQADSDLKEVIAVVKEKKYSRIPVYDKNLDDIIGILYVKDFIQYLVEEKTGNFNLRKIVRSPYFVPFSKKNNMLFKELKKNRIHIAIVIDEYGGTAGIVTIEDLIEEITGNIFDEYDIVENDIKKIDKNTYVVKGTASLDMIKEHLNISLPVDDYETLSGFVTGQLGRIPNEGEKAEIQYNNLVFKVEKVIGRRIGRIKIIIKRS